MAFEARPVTTDRWPDLVELFDRPIVRTCFCMFNRKGGDTGAGTENQAAMKALVDGGTVPGLIGYQDGAPVAWVSLGPREDYGRLQRSPIMKPVDDRPVWSIVCFFVVPEARGQGLADRMLNAAVEYARSQGATLLEAYPVDRDARSHPDSMFFGPMSIYERAGFPGSGTAEANAAGGAPGAAAAGTALMAGIKADQISRIHYGYFVTPAGYPDAGQPTPVCGYVVRHPGGTLLFDTGISPMDEETREHYHPRVRTPEEALESVGLRPTDIDLIANCHMHADHAGGNHRFPKVTVLVQKAELEAARGPDYTYPTYVWDYPGARMEIVEGEVQVAPGLRLVPTSGHSPGHQSLLVETDRGPLLLAGQAFNTASEFSFAAFSERLSAAGLDEIGAYPDWMPHVARLKVERALFAHDLLVYERDDADLGHPQQA